MRASDGHRIDARPAAGRRASASLWIAIGLLLCASASLAQPSQNVQNVVSPAEQRVRDDERLRILREELKKSEALLEALARRRAERLAAADTLAADEAEEQRIRTLSDVAGLKREIAWASRANQEAPARPQGAAARPTSMSAPRAAPTRPWWDVYGKSRRPEAPSPISFASPPVEADARSVSAHRQE
jgi:hypothetical protein